MLKDIRIDPDGYHITANLVKPKGGIKSICMIAYGDDIEVQLCDDIQDDEYDGGDVVKTMNFDLGNLSLEQSIYNLAHDLAHNLKYFIPCSDRADDTHNPVMMKVVRKHFKPELTVSDNIKAIQKKKIMVDRHRFRPRDMLLISACHAIKKELEAKGIKCAEPEWKTGK